MQRNGNPRVSVVVPTRNEARNLEVVLPAIAAVRPAVHEIIVVDGHSVDGTHRDRAAGAAVGAGRSPRPARARATRWPAGSPRPPATSSSCSTPTAPPTPPRSPPSSPRSSPAPTSPRAAGSPPAAAATTSPLLRRSGNAGLNGVANALFGTSYTDLCYGYNAFWADLLPLLDLPDPADRPHPPTACSGATASRSRPCSTAASPPPACASPRSPPSSAQRIFGRDQPAHLRRRHPRAAHAGRRAAPGGAAAGPRRRAARAAVRGGRCAVLRARRIRLRLRTARRLRRRRLRPAPTSSPRDTRASWTSRRSPRRGAFR